MTRRSIIIDFDIDLKFWHLIPSININLHSHELEFEFMCIGLYASIKKPAESKLWNKLPEFKSLFK